MNESQIFLMKFSFHSRLSLRHYEEVNFSLASSMVDLLTSPSMTEIEPRGKSTQSLSSFEFKVNGANSTKQTFKTPPLPNSSFPKKLS